MFGSWGPSLIIALAAVIGVAFGAVMRAFSGRTIAVLLAAAAIIAAIAVWVFTRNYYLLLPFAAVLLGLFYRRGEIVTLSLSRHGRDDPHRRA